LGLDSLKYYDQALTFKDGNPTPKGDPDWIIENGQKMYSELSPETKEFFDYMLENELMDLVNKKGKAAGGYCTILPEYRSPFIFSNFNGTSHDISVLTHEAGHAFQVFSSRNSKVHEYFFPTMEACEIHSMSMEFFTMPWMDLFFKEDTEKFRYHNIAKAIKFLPYGAAVDEFQHVVYENPEMTPKERNQAWREIEKKFLPHKDYDGNEFLENGGFWMRQMHIFKSPFYYIDYTLAQVCAFQFFIRMNEDFQEAWKDYIKLCKAGGSMSFLELVDYANLQSPFEEKTMRDTIAEIETYFNSVDDSKL
jgi:M3 family oligoendopeptidase